MQAQHALLRVLKKGLFTASVACLAAAPAAGAATYPVAAGNGFSGGTEGWTGLSASCNQPAPFCSTQNAYAPTQGTPPGSIESRTDILVNGGQLFTGLATWRSPAFVATTIGAGTLEYDRQLTAPGLASVEPTVTVEDVLVNETTGKSKSLGVEQLALADGVFRGRSVVVKSGTLALENRYHLEMRSRMTTNSAQAGPTGSIAVRFDNVGLELDDRGPGGSSGSDGVTFTGPPLSDKQISKLVKRTKWFAEKGNLPGGSIVARKDCTIVGTPKADRITGSKGNDVICGLGGNDKIVGRGGKDLIDGGSGKDRLSGSAKGDTLAGLAGKDRLKGGSKNDRVGAGAKGDRLYGNGGNDRLNGGGGRDRISGGPGQDRAMGNVRGDRLVKVERPR